MPLEVPFGRYALLQRIAAGGMAELFLARQKGLEGFEKLCAIKRILPTKSGDKRFVEMFLEEARLAARLSHPNIAQIYDLGIENGTYYLAMEFISGENLGTVQRRALSEGKTFPIPLAIKIAVDVCEGLFYAHEMRDPLGRQTRVVHCDISPQNILIGNDGTVKLVDFGIARAMAPRGAAATGTGQHELLGKASYMAPEQITGDTLDGTTDIFALGIVLYELCAARRLFAREDDHAVMKAVKDDPIPPLSAFAPDIPPGLEQAIHRALSRNRKDRYPDARAFEHDLVASLSELGGVPGAAALNDFMAELFGNTLQKRTIVDQTRTAVLPYSATADAKQLVEVLTIASASTHSHSHSHSHSQPRPAPSRPSQPPPLPADPGPVESSIASPIEVPPPSQPGPHARRRRFALIGGAAGLVAAAGGLLWLSLSTPSADSLLAAPALGKPQVVELHARPRPPVAAPPPIEAAQPPPHDPPRPPIAHDPPPRKVARTATLSINTQPWTKVVVDGRSLGATPIHEVRVPAGKRTLTFSNPDLGLHLTTRVDLAADRRTSLRFMLEKRAKGWTVARQVKL